MFKDSTQIINTFLSTAENKKTDYLKHENSNYVYSLPLLRHNLNNKAEEDYLLNRILPKELKELYEEGIVYIHDRQLSPYCLSVSCRDIATFGIPTKAKNMLASQPAKRLDTLLRHFSNVIVLMSQQVSGAVMLSQMSTISASYLYYEEQYGNKTHSADQLKQLFQSLIWEMNMPLRAGSQSAFSNITLEFGKPSEEIRDEYIVIAGETLEIKYQEIPTIYFNRINQAIIDVMAEGPGTGIPFTFPLITVQIDDNFDLSNSQFLYLLEKMYNWGGVYFENFRTQPFEDSYYKELNPYLKAKDPEASRSLCCRLQIDLELLTRIGSGIFGSSTGSTGAVQVLNLNANRLLMEYGHDKGLLFTKLKEYLTIMQNGHQAKRKWIEDHKELYPTFFAFNKDLKNYFNVFSLTGMHEGLINTGYSTGLTDPNGKKLAHEIMQYMTEIVNEFIAKDQVACGIEYAPAENAGIKLARHDLKWAQEQQRDIFVQGADEDIYLTSGCMLPFSEENFLEQLENSAEFQGYATSGSVLHHFLESKVEPPQLAKYIDNIFKKPINYITLTPTITSCLNCGQQVIAQDARDIHTCPVCDSNDLATFSRVIGYMRMISRKNIRVEQGFYTGEENFWSKARRYDWNSRIKLETLRHSS